MRKFLLFVFLIALVAWALWQRSDIIATRAIRYALERNGVPVQSLTVEKVSKTHVIAREVALGSGGEIKAAKADVKLSWNGNTVSKVDAVLTDADITGQLAGDALTIGGIEQLWSAKVAGEGEITTVHLVGDLTLHYEMGGAVSGRSKHMIVTAEQEGKPLFLPLTAAAEAEGNLADVIRFNGSAISEKKEIDLTFKGTYKATEKTASIDWKSKPITFKPDGFTLAQLSPAYAGEMQTYPMKVSIEGNYALRKGAWKLTPKLTFQELSLEALLNQLLGDNASISGIITGGVPLTITPEGWKLNSSALKNKGDVHIAVSPTGAAAGMIASHPEAEVVLKALSNFQVETMTLDAESVNNQGEVKFTWHFLGRNPDLYGGKKIDFTLAVTANLEDIWLSATEVDRITKEAEKTQGESR